MNHFDPNTHIQTVIIVGVGGTGAQVARIVARILYDMRRARLHTPNLLLIDPDHVEEKNVGRQLFTPADAALNLPKAEVVGKRLNMALGMDIAWCVEPFNAEKHGSRSGAQLVIGCVDNYLARRELHAAKGILIGARNYRDGGQVVMGNTGDADLMRRHLDGKDGKYAYLPKEDCCFQRCSNRKRPRQNHSLPSRARNWCCAGSKMYALTTGWRASSDSTPPRCYAASPFALSPASSA